MKIEIMNVTPKMAAKFLESNTANRKINKNHLAMIVRAINNHEWRLNHQGIAFYEGGEIADGQHRLSAIIETGKTLEMPVFTGIKRDIHTSLSIDCGRSRTVIDGANISGDNLSGKDVVLAKGLKYGYDVTFPKLSHSESYLLCKEIEDQLNITNKLFKKHKVMLTIAPVKVACVAAIEYGVKFGVIESFVNTLITGEYTNPLMVNAVKVRNKLLSQNFNGGSDRSLAFNMVINALIRTASGNFIARVNTAKPRTKKKDS